MNEAIKKNIKKLIKKQDGFSVLFYPECGKNQIHITHQNGGHNKPEKNEKIRAVKDTIKDYLSNFFIVKCVSSTYHYTDFEVS